jgi:hypothetical protein
MFANTTFDSVTHEIFPASARLHTHITVIAFWTNVCAVVSNPAGQTFAPAIDWLTSAVILTLAMLRATGAEESFGTWGCTVLTGPAGKALANSGYVMTIAAIFTIATIRAILAVGPQRARMFAHGSNVPGTTLYLTGHVIARFLILKFAVRTDFFTALSVMSDLAWDIALRSGPTSSTITFAGFTIARTLVLAVATCFTLASVESERTFRFAFDTLERWFAVASSSNVVAALGIVVIAVARVLAISTVSPVIAFLVA